MEQPEKIEIEAGERLTLTWPDGTVSVIGAAALRAACACADCRSAPAGRKGALRLVAPMLVTISDARLVGGYGLSFMFEPDAHNTGIFTFDQLRALVPGIPDTST